MKNFKHWLLEQTEYKTINLMLQDFTSGAIEDFDNAGSFMDLFGTESKGIPKALKMFNLVIIDNNNNLFNGKGVVVKDNMTFNLSSDTEPYNHVKTLNVELAKLENGDYEIKSAKVS